ncbi:DUF3310 domain-containing protein [Stutzerimonas nitrititolerans]|uniref:DUF3310 domain-containing protein n=1 Tax=Stutzerimonas nitrititolerans TaxID=2482751 RepID=UPI002899903D|nr:DUF3310 domain-containing protein [Stutzerimonas nitrititolerans]
MSFFSLTKGSAAALGMLARHAGSETLLLTQPARELRAAINIEPFTSVGSNLVLAELVMREQRHSMTLQRDDGANAQHLADWVEAAANGTLDTAEAIPQRAAPAELLPCWICGSKAIGYDYAIPGNAFRNGVKCRRSSCQSVEGAETSEAAHDAWNTIQREDLDEQPDATADMVNHPPHYTVHPSGVECIEVAEHLPFCLGNAFKYLFHRDAKGNPLENIEKAIWYVNRHNETYPAKPALPEEAREALGQIVVHEPYPFAQAMLLIAGPDQCGGYDNCMLMLQEEAQRLRSGAEPRLAA